MVCLSLKTQLLLWVRQQTEWCDKVQGQENRPGREHPQNPIHSRSNMGSGGTGGGKCLPHQVPPPAASCSFQAHAVTHSVSETHALKQGKGTRWTPVRGRVYSSTHNRLRDKFQAQVQAQESLPPSWSVGHSVTVTHSLQGYLPKPCCTWQQCLLSTKA